MRKEFNKTVTEIFNNDKKVFLLLGDIGVFGFKDLLSSSPSRALNFGILEQSMIGAAAGISSEGFLPIIHTIAPFMVERAYEQIKIDLAYQKLNANLVSVGGSYDYSALGCTHHCPSDVSIMYNIPGAKIFLPGSPDELRRMIKNHYLSGLNYFRLSEESHESYNLPIGFTNLYSNLNSDHALIFIGPTLRFWNSEKINPFKDIWYLNYIDESLEIKLPSNIKKCTIIQDFYNGPIEDKLRISNKELIINSISPKRKFIETYGSRDQAYDSIGLSKNNISKLIYNE
jgi:transketolase